jgi:hypothetical protein
MSKISQLARLSLGTYLQSKLKITEVALHACLAGSTVHLFMYIWSTSRTVSTIHHASGDIPVVVLASEAKPANKLTLSQP